MSQVEMAANLIGEYFLDYTINERVPQPVGNRSPYAAPYNAYRCKGFDQWCAISVFNDDEWAAFCKAIGSPHWTKEAKFADLPSRLKHVDELDKHVEEWTLQHDQREVMMLLQNAGVAAGACYRPAEVLDDVQLKWLNAIVEVDHPVAGKRLYPNNPFHISDVTLPPYTPAALHGQHTEEICWDLLKMSADEIKSLTDEGVLQVSTRKELEKWKGAKPS
jgi:benzylsuccinate CoA-transferase BbsF subunit